MKKIFLLISISITYLFSHCQIPCGIYDDSRIILEIEQHIQTIEKAINKIEAISNSKKTSPQDNNQLIRWINTKEEHAQFIQTTMSEYFLAQRIKPKEIHEKGYDKYIELTTLCQKIIFTAMKTKQSVDLKYIEKLNRLVNLIINTYFDEHGREHLNSIRPK